MHNSVFQVKAKEHSVSGGVGLATGITVRPGQLLQITADPNDRWSAGVKDRVSNANGLGNPLGGNYGLHTRGDQSFLYGALVGSLDGGKTFFGVGTSLTMTLVTDGKLTLHYWDSNNHDNSGTVRVMVRIYNGPINVNPI
ncbi:hypothetical protein [Enhygromyxa salina]|uniref:Uncharacterized protein n=1 Tax=Enhygromyxa salina TaxID=215803 RepID=A0A2S9YKW2_9BACT|nr:hypothetical protein [Enhygromyxa salina]PRQ05694.1 hypothetical protein ENSA7_44270 [Enhygromyxa salina]